ncbi:MAG: SMC-Scp complex subunit ScpB [Candidatus Thorarchaeota archaeon]
MDETHKNEIEDSDNNQSDHNVKESSEFPSKEAELEGIDENEAELEGIDENETELEEFEDFHDELDGIDNIEETVDVKSTEEQSIELSKEDLESELKIFNRNLIEAALYASGKPLDIEELSTKLEIPKKEVETLIQELAYDYMDRPTALVINQVGERYQMALRTEYVERVAKFSGGGGIAERYLRTLTVIALKQPILKSLVIKLRGTGAYEHIKYLIDNEFISAVKKGRSDELTTTDKYSEMFGLPRNKEELKKAMINQLGIETEQK